jgi:hypothetical protein
LGGFPCPFDGRAQNIASTMANAAAQEAVVLFISSFLLPSLARRVLLAVIFRLCSAMQDR